MRNKGLMLLACLVFVGICYNASANTYNFNIRIAKSAVEPSPGGTLPSVNPGEEPSVPPGQVGRKHPGRGTEAKKAPGVDLNKSQGDDHGKGRGPGAATPPGKDGGGGGGNEVPIIPRP